MRTFKGWQLTLGCQHKVTHNGDGRVPWRAYCPVCRGDKRVTSSAPPATHPRG